MAWSSPRTWVDGEVNTAAQFNAHLRDNALVLKTTRDAAGRISALSSATLADLSAANLTGLAFAGQGNSYTARTRLIGTSRCVVPVGANLWTGTKGVDAKGFWVEGDYLHHIASDLTQEWRYLGDVISTPAGAVVGSVWVESDSVHYIDASGVERRCLSTQSAHSDTNALPGSAWAETYVHTIRETGTLERVQHADITHSDHSDHSDTPHSDSHGDTHSDSHGDAAHVDEHGDHSDGPGHGDTHGDHTDSSHVDTHTDTHSDVDHSDGTPHSDVTADSRPVTV